MTDKQKIGRVTAWDRDKQHGFIRCTVSSYEHRIYYFDRTVLLREYRLPIVGDRVGFHVTTTAQGDRATDVQFLLTGG